MAFLSINGSVSGTISSIQSVSGEINSDTVRSDYFHLRNKPSINGVELVGDRTSAELKEHYVYEQTVASELWTITHGMGKYPSVSVVDSAGTAVVGDVQYLDEDSLTVSFTAPFIGTAYLN